MTRYERQCRRLLATFPPTFQMSRGEEFVATMVDDAPPGARRVRVLTALNVVSAGVRMRAEYAGGGGSLRASVGGGIAASAVAAIGLQAAVAAASAVFFLEHGVVFWLNGPGDRAAVVGAQHPVVWVVVALVCAAGLLAAARGRAAVAAACSIAGAAYPLVVAAVMVHAVSASRLASALTVGGSAPAGPTGGTVTVPGPVGSAPGLSPSAAARPTGPGVAVRPVGPGHFPGGSFSFRYQNFVSTPAFLAIGVVAAAAAVAVAWRHRRTPPLSATATSAWLAGVAGLAVVLAAVGDGSGATGSWPNLGYGVPPQGGVMTAFQYLWGIAVVVGIVWAFLDPRVGWATAFVSLPFVVYQISSLTVGSSYYGELYQPWWQTDLPLIAAALAIGALGVTAGRTNRVLRRL